MMKRRRLGWVWDHLARHNALGAILTKDGELADWNSHEFFATGRADIDRFMTTLSSIAPGAPRTRALDFGCGVGRATRALAAHFDEVVGADVAPSMIEHARELNADCGGCRFVLNRAPHLQRFPAGSFSVVYSRLVLQHVRPALVRRYVPELVRVLARGGVLMFQLPEFIAPDPEEAFERAPVLGHPLKRRLPPLLVVAYRRVKYRFVVRDPKPEMDMFGMPRDEVLELIRGGGGRVLAVLPDQSHGTGVPGFEYWVTRAIT
jgi:SAM-dependent methyltransferase